MARLADKEVYIIDGEKYIKVPTQSNEKENIKFRYVKVERYLAGEIESLPLEAERIKRKEAKGVEKAKREEVKEPGAKKTLPLVSRPLNYPYLKRKIAVLPFDDHTKLTYERFGEIIAERLAKKMEIKVFSSLVMDRAMVALTLEKLDLNPEDLKDPSKATLLNETLGIQGIIRGEVYGPFVTCSTSAQSEKSSMAIVRIEVQFIDAAHGRIIKEFAAGNPLAESREIGVLSEEKAKYRAVDLAIDQILTEVAEELNGMDWFTRIALVEGKMVYLNAGYQTGLKEGDLLEVYPAGDLGGTKPIGRIRVSRLFGVDASAAQVMEGSGFQVNDVVRPLPQS
ncbi:MAG: hypothetical protein JSW32_02115 [Deltaproteobacteria bacterium]|nr:MAG: hypothetical protein JSW32_02115 [Deltaproteobacteria bacterium]